MTKDGLINCKKCGAMFFKTSGREICENCYKKELDVIDGIKDVIASNGSSKITLEKLSGIAGVDLTELKNLVSRGKLTSVLNRLALKRRFCGIELKDDEKTGFTCKECLLKFSPNVNELKRAGVEVSKREQDAKTIDRRLRGGYRTVLTDNAHRFGFIQNYDL